MALPKIKHTVYTHHLTGLDKDVRFRCFTNAEQKMLLEAKEEQDPKMVYENTKQVVQSCIIDDINVDDLSIFDFEDIFIRIRAKSVDKYITGQFEIKYEDEDGKERTHTHKYSINTDDIKVVTPEEKVSNIIDVTDDYKLKMKYPSMGSAGKHFETEDDFIIEHIECVFSDDGDEVTYLKDEPEEDVHAFYADIEGPTMIEIAKFLGNQPKLSYTMDIDLPNGKTKKVVFESIEDFFT